MAVGAVCNQLKEVMCHQLHRRYVAELRTPMKNRRDVDGEDGSLDDHRLLGIASEAEGASGGSLSLQAAKC